MIRSYESTQLSRNNPSMSAQRKYIFDTSDTQCGSMTSQQMCTKTRRHAPSHVSVCHLQFDFIDGRLARDVVGALRVKTPGICINICWPGVDELPWKERGCLIACHPREWDQKERMRTVHTTLNSHTWHDAIRRRMTEGGRKGGLRQRPHIVLTGYYTP